MEGPSHGGHQTQGGPLQQGWHHFDRRQPINANQDTAGPMTCTSHSECPNGLPNAQQQTPNKINTLKICFLGKAYQKDKLLGYAYAYGQDWTKQQQ
jgi:hypothetical protein